MTFAFTESRTCVRAGGFGPWPLNSGTVVQLQMADGAEREVAALENLVLRLVVRLGIAGTRGTVP